jgi:dihydroflavonol-4-reductase
MIEIARAIRSGLGEVARKVSSRELPNWVAKLVALFDPTAWQIVSELGREVRIDNTITRETLHVTFIPATEAAAAMARSLIDLDVV